MVNKGYQNMKLGYRNMNIGYLKMNLEHRKMMSGHCYISTFTWTVLAVREISDNQNDTKCTSRQ